MSNQTIKFPRVPENYSDECKAARALRERKPAGMEIVVWQNMLSKCSKKSSIGFNFQPLNKFKMGDVVENAFSGNTDHATGNACKVIAIY